MIPSLAPSGYVAALRAALDELPGPPLRFRATDRRLAIDLYSRRVPIEVVRAALYLATLRRLTRDVHRPQLAPVRSLYYYLPVVDELLRQPLDPAWGRYLVSRLARLTSQASTGASILSAPVQNSAFSNER